MSISKLSSISSWAMIWPILISSSVFSTEVVKKSDNIFKQTQNFQYIDRALPAGRMNQAQHEELRYIAIDGDKIIIEEGHNNNLYNLINNRRNVKELEINADVIELRDPLRLPQTNIRIRARVFKFIDDDNIAVINTSPFSVQHELEMGQDGQNGEDAGDIKFFVERIKYNNHEERHTRMILNGGQGQNGGQGKPGGHGRSIGTNFGNNTVYVESGGEVRGAKTCPSNGEDAIEAGQPGHGGNGGRFISLFNSTNIPEKFVQSLAGSAGETTKYYKGGNAGTPVIAKWNINGQIHKCEKTVDGKYADRKSANKGRSGILLTKRVSPYSPAPIKQRLYLANEEYRKFRGSSLAKLDSLKTKYKSIEQDILNLGISNQFNSSLWARIPEVDKVEIEDLYKQTLKQRNKLERSIDYFGYPFGFVPFVNLKTNMKIYKERIEQSIEKLHLAKWFISLMEGYKTDSNALNKLLSEKDSQRNRMISRINSSAKKLEKLNVEINQVKHEEELLSDILEVYKKDLQALIEKGEQLNAEEFERKKKLMRAIKLGTSVAKVLPVYQPALGMGAQTLDTAVDALTASDEDFSQFTAAANKVDWSKAKSSGEEMAKELNLNKSEACEAENKAPNKPKLTLDAEIKSVLELKEKLLKIVLTKITDDNDKKSLERIFLKRSYPVRQIQQMVNLFVKRSEFKPEQNKKLDDLYAKTKEAEVKRDKKKTENNEKLADYETKLAEVLDKRQECERDIQYSRVKGGVKYAADIYKSYSDFKEKFEKIQYNGESVEAILEKRLASDPYFQEFNNRVQSLMRKKASVLKSIDSQTAIMASEITSVAQNFYEIDHLRTHFSLNYARFDKKAYEYVKKMEREATESLEKQFYYLVRSYEHVLLRDYDGNLDIGKIVNSFKDIIKDQKNGVLSKEDLESLYELYKQDLKDVQNTLISEIQVNAPSQTNQNIPARIKLSSKQLEILAKEGRLLVSLANKPSFASFENLRIDKLRIDAKVSDQEVDTLLLNVSHSGSALIKNNGEENFFIYNSQTQQPIVLSGVQYTSWDGEFSDNTPVLNDELSFDEYGIDSQNFMPRFGARTQFEIVLKAFSNTDELKVKLDSLELFFELKGRMVN